MKSDATTTVHSQRQDSVFRNSRLKSYLGVVVFIVNLLVIGVGAHSLSHSRDEYELKARVEVENLSQVLADNIRHSIDRIDFALQVASDEYAHQLGKGKPDATAMTAFLDAQLPRLPSAENFRAMDDRGIVLYGRGVPTNPRVDLSDRDFFIAGRDNPDAGLIIGQPILARISKKWLIPLSRRVNRPDGSFGGIVYSAITIEYFNTMFAQLNIGPEGVISLRDENMGLIARHPQRTDIGIDIGSRQVSAELMQLVKSGKTQETYYTPTGSDNIPRIVSFRKLGELPLYIIVGEGTTHYLQHWRSDAALLGTLAAFLFFGSITLSFMLTRSWNRQNQATETLAEQEFKFRTVADYTYDWEYWLGLEGEFLYISPSCERITGYAAGEFIANPKLIYEIMVPEDRRLMEAHIANIREDDHGTLDFRIMTKQGEMRWIAHGCQAVFGPDGRYLGRRANNRDITERKLAEEQVRQLAYYDALTGLPNRRLLLERLDHALVQAKRFSRSLAVMFLDLDNFKKINDSLGHEAGDLLLKEVATRLAAGIRSGDTVARQGGDEFIIVLSEIADPHDASLVAEKVLSQLAGVPVSLAGQDISISTSIGIAVYPIAGTDSSLELMKKADAAMYDAKHAGRNRYCFYGSV